MNEQDQGVTPSGPGSQASPEAARASSPSVSIPNAVTFRQQLGYRTKVSRVRSVEVHLGKTPRHKRAWAIKFRNRGNETEFCLSDDGMVALVALYEKINAINAIRDAIGGSRAALMHRVECEWRVMDQDASGIEAQSDETPQAAQPEGREPGAGTADAPKVPS